VALSLVTAAWSQTTPATSSDDNTAGSVLSSLTDLAGTRDAIKQQLRAEYISLVDSVIHAFFSELRTQWGLSQSTTASAFDPLSGVENLVVQFVDVWLQQQ